MPGPPSRLLRRALALAFGVAVALSAAEMGYRVLRERDLGPTTNPRYVVHDEQLGWRYAPGARARHVTPEFDVTIAIGPHGFRGGPWPPRDPDRPCVLVLGDSFAFGWGVEETDTFSSLLAARRPEWDVRNAAVSGYGTDQELLLLEQLAPRLRPDVVVVVFCPNDLEEIASSRMYGHEKPWFERRGGRAEPAGEPAREGFLARHSALWRALVKTLAGRVATSADPAPERRALLVALYERMALAAGDAPLVIVGSDAALEPLAGRAPSIVLLDPAAALAAPGPPATFAHDGHWTPSGHRRVADALGAILDRRLDVTR